MKTSAPTTPVFIIAVILAVLAVLMFLGVIPEIGLAAFWVLLAGFVVLLSGNLFAGW